MLSISQSNNVSLDIFLCYSSLFHSVKQILVGQWNELYLDKDLQWELFALFFPIPDKLVHSMNCTKLPPSKILVYNFLFLCRFKNWILIEVIALLYDCQHLLFIPGKLFSWTFLYVCRYILFQKAIILYKNVWDVFVTSLSLALDDKFLEWTPSTGWNWGRLNLVEGNLSHGELCLEFAYYKTWKINGLRVKHIFSPTEWLEE